MRARREMPEVRNRDAIVTQAGAESTRRRCGVPQLPDARARARCTSRFAPSSDG
jgi:hypothetical protein